MRSTDVDPHHEGAGSAGARYRAIDPRSGRNAKLGPIWAVYADRRTCPDSCGLKGNGCYAEKHLWMRWAWHSAHQTLDEVLERVAALPPLALWRWGVAGDLPGAGEHVDGPALMRVVDANRGKHGFAFTHKPATWANRWWIALANAHGFTINWSAEGLAEADRLANLRAGPVVAVVPSDSPTKGLRTPEGRPVVVCPAEWHVSAKGAHVQCATCGACANPDRRVVIAFRAHGHGRKHVDALLSRGPEAPGS